MASRIGYIRSVYALVEVLLTHFIAVGTSSSNGCTNPQRLTAHAIEFCTAAAPNIFLLLQQLCKTLFLFTCTEQKTSADFDVYRSL
jgi:hypothetical protein